MRLAAPAGVGSRRRFDAWLKQVAAVPAEKQVDAVAAKLKELNPGFDGKVTPRIENGVVTGLEFLTDNVTDISPVRALPGLKSSCSCRGQQAVGRLCGRASSRDLSPLKGDVALKGMKLKCGYEPRYPTCRR